MIPPGRIYLVAVERNVEPPVMFGDAMLQRVRVVLAPHSEIESQELAPIPPQTPPAPSRAVRGEILRDETGRYYEKIGNFVRELGQLGASAEGDLVEVPPPAKSEAAAKDRPNRKLFPDPGQWRVLRWGEFKALLAPQIAHPERLRDEHRLACYVQVVEAGSKQPVVDLAAVLFGDPSFARELLMLSPAAAARLELQDLLPQPKEENAPRERGFVLAGDRLFRLRVAADPTAAATPAEPPTPPKLKRSIPELFSSGDFARTRDEALSEMRTPYGFSARLTGLKQSLFARAAFEKWQRSLWGKSLDDQLWGIRPPAGMLGDPAAREWAAATLDLAGYDLGVMLREWEIFWRRRPSQRSAGAPGDGR